MSADYLNLDQLIEKLIEIRETQKQDHDTPVLYEDSSGYNYYVRNVSVIHSNIVIN